MTWSRLIRLTTALVPIAFLAACESQPAPQTSPDLSVAGSLTDPNYVQTPAGQYHISCVHEIPNGAHVDFRTMTVTRSDRTSFQIPACSQPIHPNLPSLHGRGTLGPTNDGWIEWASDQVAAGSNYADLSAAWRVPVVPSGSYSGTQLYYSFPGLENVGDVNVYIIQPVLQFGNNNQFGGSYWSAASWRCNSGSDCLHGTPITVSPGDSVIGTVDASACVGGTCTWTIAIVDVTQGTRSNWTATDTQNYTWATGGAVEVYGLTSCSQYPDTVIAYGGISLLDQTGTQLSPNWGHNVQSGTTPSCGFDLASGPGSVDLYYNRPPPPPPPPTLTVQLSGPTTINAKGSYSWTATPSGGTGAYSYQWSVTYDSGPQYQLGSSATQSLTVFGDDGDFTIAVTVTSGAQQVSSSQHVRNCINAGSCQPLGPSGGGA